MSNRIFRVADLVLGFILGLVYAVALVALVLFLLLHRREPKQPEPRVFRDAREAARKAG